ncbi:MAG: prolipoprotein diacylglyceryl transferase [Pseudomonadota bacterium]
MTFAIPFPEISPEIFSITLFGMTFALRWYAMAYIAGILIAWWMAARAVRNRALWPAEPPANPEQIGDLVTWVILGVIAGGRLGFVLFYEPAYYVANPLEIPAVWQGGMSFHGGFLGVVIAALIYCRRQGLPLLPIADVMALTTPPAIALGRGANFINGELWGRPTDAPWGVIFPGAAAQDCPAASGVAGLCARHPSQLYEAALEGVLLALVLLWVVYRRRAFFSPGLTLGLFVGGYGAARFVVEFFRQADAQFITPDNPWGWVLSLGPVGLTMGQLLSLPMILVGAAFIVAARRRSPQTSP